MTAMRSLLGLLTSFVICFGAGLIGSAFTARSVGDWYLGLSKPAWTPPSSVFGPVWTLLYSMMAVAAWLVWRQAGFAAAAFPLTLFVLQLLFNAGWSLVFFGLRMPGAAFVEITVLWVLILASTVSFWQRAPIAGYLMLPYLGWVSFAAALNFALWRMNL